nr:hypothetical protein [Tanacetum cinerariifolium]
MHKAFPLSVMEFPLPKEVPTASEECFHCRKKRDAAAEKIALLLKSSKMDQQNPTLAKIPILDTGKFEQWKFKIQQYLQHEHYALWEVIEFGDSYEVPKHVTTGSASDGTGKKKGRTVTLTTDDMQKRKNDVKARTTLLLALPDEHQLQFSKHKTAQELWAAILKTFGGNEATKKTKKNLLKQQYGNFKAKGSKTLEQTFNRLQVIFSHLEFVNIEIEKDDLNQKFLTSLPPEWLMHTIVWRNRSDLDTMSLDDLYNHLKVYESKVQKKSESNSHNMAFISSAKHNSGNEKVNIASVSTASTKSSIASANIKVANISQDTACAYIASQSSDVTGFDKSKVECFNCHKMGHFARECRAPRSQDRGKRDNYRQGSKVEEHDPKALMAIDGVGWDWSYMTNDEENHALVVDEEVPTEFALMAKTNTERLAQVEARLEEHRNQEVKYCEKIRVLEFKTESIANCIESLTKELELIKKEKEGLDSKLAGFQTASKDLDNLLESQRLDKNKEGWPTPTIESFPDDAQNRNPSVTEIEASPSTISPKPFIKFVKATDRSTETKTAKVKTAKLAVKYAAIKFPTGSSKFSTADMGKKRNAVKASDSGCSRHMTCNISYLSDYEPFDGGYVSFGQGGCKITGKETIKTSKLEFQNVYFVKDLKYNLFNVSQICDNKNSVLFTDSKCIVLGRDFKLLDDANVLLRTPRQHNMYSIDLNNIIPHKDLTCLVAKASADESMLWNRRLGHLNFKTMNRLVRHNIVRGLPSKCFENDHTCTACLKGKQHKASYKSKLVNSVTKPLHTLHMDLFGPTSDETSGILRKFITKIENLKDLKVKITRRNRTLIEAARTMLADAKLPVTFWAEAVNTACYVQNRVLVNKTHNKTPYALFNGRSPAIEFLKPFGCHVMIFDTLDHLGKFEAKGDECYFIRYSMSSKAFRVFNKRTKRVKENLHVEFLENKAIEKGAGPNWLFDINSLTKSMNYVPVVAGTNSTNLSDTKDAASQEPQDDCSTNAPESSGNSNPTATLTNPSADQMETLIVETPIPTVSSLVPTACFTDSPEPPRDTRLISKRVANQVETPSLDNILTLTNRFEDILGVTTNSVDSDGVEANVSNIETTITASPTPTLRIHKDHSKSQIIGPVDTLIQNRNKSKETLVDCPKGVRPIGTKWVLKNKKDEREIVIRNKARLVSQGHTQEKGIDFDEVFSPVARIEAIKLFLAYALFMGFIVYQMDVKSAFHYGTIDEEVYVMHPPGFQDPEFLAKVYKVEKAMYGLHQAPRAWEVPVLSCQIVSKGLMNSSMSILPLQVCMDRSEHNVNFHPIVDFFEASQLRYALTHKPTVYVSHIRQFWSTARTETMDEGTKILATVDGILRTVFESSIRRNHKLKDEARISSLPDAKLFENLTLMGYNISPNQKFTFQKGTPTEPSHTPSPEAQHTLPTTYSSPTLPPVTTANIPPVIPTDPLPTVVPTDTPQLRHYTRRARIAQSSALPPISDEPASHLRDVNKGEAFPTDSGFEADQDRANIAKTSTLPSDSTPRVTSLVADEGSMQYKLDELTALCTSLQRQQSKMVEEVATVLTSMDATTVLSSGVAEVPTSSGSIPTAGPPATRVPTGSDVVPSAGPIFATATVVTPYTPREGKEKMIESETPKKKKIQEQMDIQMARQLEEEMERDAKKINEQIARDCKDSCRGRIANDD